MNQEDFSWMERLSNAFGPSGFEEEVTAVAREYAQEFADVEEDNIRNLYIKRRSNTGDKPLIMLDAHSDEVGFMVQFIKPNGTLQFLPLGSWNESSIPGTKVYVRNQKGEYIPGIVAAKPVHFMTKEEANQMPHIQDMVIDIGAVSDQEAKEVFGVQVGDPVAPAVSFQQDPVRGIMTGKAFDCRVGCLALLKAMKALADEELAVDVIGVLSSQEEVGGRGARVAARRVDPVITLGFEGCPADDTFTPDYAVQSAMKKGPMIRLMVYDYASGAGTFCDECMPSQGDSAAGRCTEWRRNERRRIPFDAKGNSFHHDFDSESVCPYTTRFRSHAGSGAGCSGCDRDRKSPDT